TGGQIADRYADRKSDHDQKYFHGKNPPFRRRRTAQIRSLQLSQKGRTRAAESTEPARTSDAAFAEEALAAPLPYSRRELAQTDRDRGPPGDRAPDCPAAFL